MSDDSMRFVLTGGPGVGKTSVIAALARAGYATVQESARDVIAEEQARDSKVLPWRDATAFQLRVLELQLEREAAAVGRIVFVDRGVPDGIAYLRLASKPVPAAILAAAAGRYALVFRLDPLGPHERDGIRYEDAAMATQVHALLEVTYLEFGYLVVRIGALPLAERVQLIRQRAEAHVAMLSACA